MFCISCVSIFKYDHLIFQASIDSGSQSNLGWTAEPWNAMSWFYSPEYYMLCLTWLLYTLIPCSTFIVCIICVSCLCQSELAYTQTRVHSWLNTYIHHSFIDLCRVSFATQLLLQVWMIFATYSLGFTFASTHHTLHNDTYMLSSIDNGWHTFVNTFANLSKSECSLSQSPTSTHLHWEWNWFTTFWSLCREPHWNGQREPKQVGSVLTHSMLKYAQAPLGI